MITLTVYFRGIDEEATMAVGGLQTLISLPEWDAGFLYLAVIGAKLYFIFV